MNIYDISEKAGVSIATVSRVINGNTNVSEKTRRKVLSIIEESGFTPNAFARGLGLDTMKTVGIMCADSSDFYLAQALYFIEKGLRKNGYDSILCCTGYDLEVKKSSMELLLSKRVDSVILIGSNYVDSNDENNDYIRSAAAKIPIMIVNGSLAGKNIYSTLCDDFEGVSAVARRLISVGKSKILYLYNSHSYSAMKKINGLYDAYRQENIPINEEYQLFCTSKSGSINGVKAQIEELYETGLGIEAIIASDDRLAIAAIKFAREKGISVPEKLWIVGYNNSDITEYCQPELTSVDNKLEAICQNCISTLMNVFSGKDMPQKTVFLPELIERGTTDFSSASPKQ